MTAERTVSLSIDTKSDAEVAKAFEVLGRIAGGLVCEGIDARIYSYTDDVSGTEEP